MNIKKGSIIQSKLKLLFFYTALSMNISFASEVEDPAYNVSLFTESITSRMYCIARVNKSVSFLYKLHSNGHLKDIEHVFSEAFFDDWQNFRQFRFLSDSEFQIEFVKKLFEILFYIVRQDKSWNSHFYVHRGSLGCLSDNLDDIFSGIDIMSLYIQKRIRPTMKRAISFEEKCEGQVLSVDCVTAHFYKIRRLQRTKKMLIKAELTNLYSMDLPTKNKDPLQELSDIVTNPTIKQALYSMIELKNLSPLLNLWDEFEQFKYVQDSRFFEEMLMSIFATYKKILITHAVNASKEASIEEELENILALYENIPNMNGQELLENIDKATDYLRDILQEIDTSKKELTLKWIIAQWVLSAGALGGVIMYLFMR